MKLQMPPLLEFANRMDKIHHYLELDCYINQMINMISAFSSSYILHLELILLLLTLSIKNIHYTFIHYDEYSIHASYSFDMPLLQILFLIIFT